ncbi:hypothetical protein CCP3SC1AL1_1870007 [Gammaproteobacteria bacterium]
MLIPSCFKMVGLLKMSDNTQKDKSMYKIVQNIFFAITVGSAIAGEPTWVPGVLGLAQGLPGSGERQSGCPEEYAITGKPGGLYHSSDGHAWVQATLGLPNTYFSSLAAGPAGVVYGTSSEGLFKTTDHGAHWNFLPTQEEVFFLLPLADGTLLARTWKKGLARSKNGGNTWYRVGSEMAAPISAILQTQDKTVWAATFGAGIYRSSDGGVTWETQGLENESVMSLAFHGENLYVGTYQNGVYQHSSQGWTKAGVGFPEGAAVETLVSTPAGLAAGVVKHGLYRLSTGVWQAITGEPDNVDNVTGILPTEEGDWLVATRPQGLFRVHPTSQHWKALTLQVSVEKTTSDGHGGAYAMVQDSRILHSRPHTVVSHCGDEDTWEYVGLAPSGTDVLSVTRAGELMAAGKRGVFIHSAESGEWKPAVSLVPNLEVTCLAETESGIVVGTKTRGLVLTDVSRSGGKTILTEGVRACASSGGRLYVLTDRGISISGPTSWKKSPLVLVPTAITPFEETVIFAQGKQLFELEGGYLPRALSIDGEGGQVQATALVFSGETLYVASLQGVDLFHREGEFWHWMGQALSRIPVKNLSVFGEGGAVAASERGLFLLKSSGDAKQAAVLP